MSVTKAICQAWGPSVHLTWAAAQEEKSIASKNTILTGLFQTLQGVSLLSYASKLEEKLDISFALPFRCFIVALPFFTAAMNATIGASTQTSPWLKKKIQWVHANVGFLYQIGNIMLSLFLLRLGCGAYAMTFLANLAIGHLIKKEMLPHRLLQKYQIFSYLPTVVSDFAYGRTVFQLLLCVQTIQVCLSLVPTKDEPEQEKIGSLQTTSA